jgi:broad specificity phosphatase PhoE
MIQKGLHKPDIVDPALSPIGEEQVSHLALKLQEEINGGMQPPTKVFTSVTKRTCQTATKAWGTVLGPATPILAMQVR